MPKKKPLPPRRPARSKPKTAIKAKAKAAKARSLTLQFWNLRLYVAGQTPKSLTAFSNLKRLCESHLAGRYRIEVIDLLKEPHLAQGDQIVAIPTLVRKLPPPIKRVIGDLSNLERVMVAIDIEPAPSQSS